MVRTKLKMTSRLIAVLTEASRFLQTKCIEQLGTNYLTSTSSSACHLPGPPLRPPAKLGDVPMHEIPPLVYGCPGDLGLLAERWLRLVPFLLSVRSQTREVSEVCADIAPSIPLTPLGHQHLYAEPVQALYAASWSSGCRVGLNHRRLLLSLPRGDIGFSSNAVYWVDSGGAQRRRQLRASPELSVRDCLAVPMGPHRKSLPDTGALYHHLLTMLPGYEEQINVVFSAAVWDGREAEAALCSMFVVERSEDSGEAPNQSMLAAIRASRLLIRTSRTNPVTELYHKLKSHVAYADFARMFGNPFRQQGKYTRKSRDKHLESLLRLEVTGSIQKQDEQKTKDVDDDAANQAALDMLAMQQLIR